MADFDPDKTWLGIGLKTGGTLFLVGMENVEGRIFKINNISFWYDLSILSVRLGPGLGGGTGLTALCVFNCDDARVRLNNTETTDWGVNVSLGGQWSKIAKGLKNYKFFTTVARVGAKLRRFVPEDAENIRNSMHYLYTEYDFASMGDAPKVMAIDIPVGVGLEVSLNYTIGKMEIN